MSENDAPKNRLEVRVGRHVTGEPFIGQVVRFEGKELGWYVAESSISDNQRKDIGYELYRCPGGYRVVRGELHYRRRKEGGRWSMRAWYKQLLPAVEEDAGQQNPTLHYGLYAEEEARRTFPELFSAVGMPNVRELD